jgi:hypothetical protein
MGARTVGSASAHGQGRGLGSIPVHLGSGLGWTTMADSPMMGSVRQSGGGRGEVSSHE